MKKKSFGVVLYLSYLSDWNYFRFLILRGQEIINKEQGMIKVTCCVLYMVYSSTDIQTESVSYCKFDSMEQILKKKLNLAWSTHHTYKITIWTVVNLFSANIDVKLCTGFEFHLSQKLPSSYVIFCMVLFLKVLARINIYFVAH